ncbi:MAG: hypothetical protein K8J31_24780 [Anaerolineae bacterium]|nr:hypothetical protein [Anaerolineae bacterium]
MRRHSDWFLITLILLTAAALRLWQLHSYPPGPHYDEAANVLITRSIAFGGANYFPIVPSYQGREALYYDLSTPLFWWVEDGRFSLQLANVFLSLLTIAATIALGRALFAGRRGRIVGLTAGALMALSFPLLLLARQAFRAPTLPLMQALALWCLWHGLRRRRTGWLIVGGVLAGGALYTYMASRLFPLWLLIGGLLLIVLDGKQRGLRLRQGLVFFGALALASAPMVVYALQNPDIFLGRLYEVTQPESSVTLAESIGLHLRMFFLKGDPLLRYNLPGRPYFTGPEGILLLVGLGLGIVRLLRSGQPLERAAYGLTLLAPLMILPSVISVGSFPPNHMRSIAMVPLIFVVPGVGAEGVLSALAHWIRPHPLTPSPSGRRGKFSALKLNRFAHLHPASIALTTVAILLGSAAVARTYFDWASRADLFYETDADLAAATAWLPAHLNAGTRVQIASEHLEHPTVRIANLPDVTWLGQTTLFRPAPGREAVVIFPRSSPPPADWAAWLEPAAMDGIPTGPDGGPAFAAYDLTGDLPLPALDAPPETVRNEALTLLGTQANPVFPGAEGEVTLYWQVDQTPAYADLTPIVQVEENGGAVLSRTDTPLSHTDGWQPGEVLIQRMTLRIPPGTPPGNLRMQVTWVARASDHYLPYGFGGVWATAGQIEILPTSSFPDPESLSIDHRAGIEAAPGVRLLGWSDFPLTRRPGESLPITLVWQGTAVEGERADLPLDVILRTTDGKESIQDNVLVGPQRYPSIRWREGEVVVEHARWQLPREQPAGTYTLVMRIGETEVELGPLEIAGLPRQFQPPSDILPSEVRLGEALALDGYRIDVQGTTLRLLLVWQALVEVETDYTVFVHVLDDSGAIIAQRDVMPVTGSYPTSLWAAGEYVLDEHVFEDLPPGRYHLRVGLYDQADGVRLTQQSQPNLDFIDLGAVDIP